MPRRTSVTSMFRYSAMPPETPVSIRCSRERRRTLPDRLENGAFEFVWVQLSRLRGLHHIRIGTDPTLAQLLETRERPPDDFSDRFIGGVVYRRGMDVDVLTKVSVGLPGVEEHEGWAVSRSSRVRNKRLRLHVRGQHQAASTRRSGGAGGARWPRTGRVRTVVGIRPLRRAQRRHRCRKAGDQELLELVTEAWRLSAPKYLITQSDAAQWLCLNHTAAGAPVTR